MGFLRQDDLAQLRRVFAGLTHDVRLVLTTDDLDLRLVIDEVASTTNHLQVEKQAETDGVEAPAMELSSALTKGKLRFLGMPVGYEMATLVGAIATAGGGLEGPLVSPETQALLDGMTSDVTLEVFSTPG